MGAASQGTLDRCGIVEDNGDGCSIAGDMQGRCSIAQDEQIGAASHVTTVKYAKLYVLYAMMLQHKAWCNQRLCRKQHAQAWTEKRAQKHAKP